MEEKYQRKLQTLMKNERVSQSRLAKMLEVESSTLSHILSGRNYPSFDILQKLRRLFPHINADWLLLETSEDYLADVSAASDRPSDGTASDDTATVSGQGALDNTQRPSGVAAGKSAATASGRGDATATGSATERTAGAAEVVGRVGDTKTFGPAARVVRGTRTAGDVGSTGAMGGGAQGMAAAPSLFDATSSSNVSSAGTDTAPSTVSAQLLSSFDRVDGVRIRRIIVLYEDNSFESFTPRL